MENNKWIKIKGAREHNLKNIDVEIPKESLTIITGPSGSGKSSLALDILFTEGKRRYMESLSSYARQFLGIAKKPDVDRIDGLCPSIAIEQKTVGHNPRSTVGTITEIYDYLRVLFARIGRMHCPQCQARICAQSSTTITSLLLHDFDRQTVSITAPVAHEKKGEFTKVLAQLYQKGYYRFIIDGVAYRFSSVDEINKVKLAKTYKHSIDVLIDSLEVTSEERSRLQEAVDTSFRLADGLCKIIIGDTEHLYSSKQMCVHCSLAFEQIEPRLFSFNSPIGACKECNGLGFIQNWNRNVREMIEWHMKTAQELTEYIGKKQCSTCHGQRLNEFARAVTVGDHNIFQLGQLTIKELLSFLGLLSLNEVEKTIGEQLLQELIHRLTFLNDVGLSYVTLNRSARTLSGGEGQRIRLATQIGSALSGVLYILDEPSIGLHQRDNDRLIETLKKLRNHGNTVVVVEHDMDTIEQSDYIIDMGPAAGVRGGMVTAYGTPKEIAANIASMTGSYLSGKSNIAIPATRRQAIGHLELYNAHKNNLQNISVKFPLGVLCGISGVSGSGKSTLIMEELVPEVERSMSWSSKQSATDKDGRFKGADGLLAMVVIDQTPIGRTPRSNPATYLGIFNQIRNLFSQLPESNARGYTPGRFSFNVSYGRCNECNGDGTKKISMQFLADVVMTCKVCDGQRYSTETLQIAYKGKNIAQVLDMTAYEALQFFQHHKQLSKRLELMCDVGLEYIKLGQQSTTLSGGEAQRIKLVDELAKRGQNTLYILDEPTTGLHNHDIQKLLEVLNRLVDKGNSMIVIEHNLDVLKTVDHIIDLGPEGGDQGGHIVVEGTPEMVVKSNASHTGRYLKKYLRV